MSEFKASLVLFPAKEKRNERSPDNSGNLELLTSDIPALLEYLESAEVEENYKGEKIVKLSVATWINEMKDGRKYLKGLVSPPMKRSVDTDSDMPF